MLTTLGPDNVCRVTGTLTPISLSGRGAGGPGPQRSCRLFPGGEQSRREPPEREPTRTRGVGAGPAEGAGSPGGGRLGIGQPRGRPGGCSRVPGRLPQLVGQRGLRVGGGARGPRRLHVGQFTWKDSGTARERSEGPAKGSAPQAAGGEAPRNTHATLHRSRTSPGRGASDQRLRLNPQPNVPNTSPPSRKQCSCS